MQLAKVPASDQPILCAHSQLSKNDDNLNSDAIVCLSNQTSWNRVTPWNEQGSMVEKSPITILSLQRQGNWTGCI